MIGHLSLDLALALALASHFDVQCLVDVPELTAFQSLTTVQAGEDCVVDEWRAAVPVVVAVAATVRVEDTDTTSANASVNTSAATAGTLSTELMLGGEITTSCACCAPLGGHWLLASTMPSIASKSKYEVYQVWSKTDPGTPFRHCR